MMGLFRGSAVLPVVVCVFGMAVIPMAGARAQDVNAVIAALPENAPISPYVISGLQIDTTAENAVKAREKAFAEALNKAYAVMVERLVPDAAERANLRTPETAEIGKLLQDFATKNEQLAPTRYTATYEIRFKPRAVQGLLGRLATAAPVTQPTTSVASEGKATIPQSTVSKAEMNEGANVAPSVPAADTTAPLALIVPFYQPGPQATLWSGANPLRDALQRANLNGTGLKAPLGDLDDVQSFDETKGLSFTPAELGTLLGLYDTQQAIIAIAVPEAATGGDVNTLPRSVNVMLYHATLQSPKPEYLQALSVSSSGVPNIQMLYGRVIDQIRAVSPGLLAKVAQATVAKEKTVAEVKPDPAAPKSLQMVARFTNLQDWQQIRGRLSGISAIQNVRVLSLKTQEARLEVIYAGTEDMMLTQMQTKGLQAGTGKMIVDAMGMHPDTTEPAAGVNSNGAPVVYELSLNPWAMSGQTAPATR